MSPVVPLPSEDLQRLLDLLLAAVRDGEQDAAHAHVDTLAELVAGWDAETRDALLPAHPEEPAPRWNTDPKWMAYLASLEPLITKIVRKSTMDESLRDDCANEARAALYQVFPETLGFHARYVAGELDEAGYRKRLKAYCGNVIRNRSISYLESPKKGNWYIGRTRRVRNPKTGEREKVRVAPRYSSLDDLVEMAGLQIDTDRNISWEQVSTDGLNIEEYSHAPRRTRKPSVKRLNSLNRRKVR